MTWEINESDLFIFNIRVTKNAPSGLALLLFRPFSLGELPLTSVPNWASGLDLVGREGWSTLLPTLVTSVTFSCPGGHGRGFWQTSGASKYKIYRNSVQGIIT